jgi:hypothetical protein
MKIQDSAACSSKNKNVRMQNLLGTELPPLVAGDYVTDVVLSEFSFSLAFRIWQLRHPPCTFYLCFILRQRHIRSFLSPSDPLSAMARGPDEISKEQYFARIEIFPPCLQQLVWPVYNASKPLLRSRFWVEPPQGSD